MRVRAKNPFERMFPERSRHNYANVNDFTGNSSNRNNSSNNSSDGNYSDRSNNSSGSNSNHNNHNSNSNHNNHNSNSNHNNHNSNSNHNNHNSNSSSSNRNNSSNNSNNSWEKIISPKQMLAVWGSPSSGKTIVAVKLAIYLATMQQQKNISLLLCDMTTPMLPCICPPSDLRQERSLGSILVANSLSPSLIRYNSTIHQHYPQLMIFGLCKGENERTYPAYRYSLAEELLKYLRSISDYIIIDCSSHIASNDLTLTALMEADAVLRLVTCDLKSISYLSSQLPLLKASHWDMSKQYKAASKVESFHTSGHLEKILGNTDFQIPHTKEITTQMLDGDLFKDLRRKNSNGFQSVLEAMAGEIFGC